MRSLKDKYFWALSDMWASIKTNDNIHTLWYKNKFVSYDGYVFIDVNNKKMIKFIHIPVNHKKGTKFKLISVITKKCGMMNFLGKCLETGRYTTFDEHQITFEKKINEK